MVKIDVAAFQQAVQIGQMALGLARSIAAAVKAGNPGADIPEDAELIRILADNSAAGKAEADALIARLQALQQ